MKMIPPSKLTPLLTAAAFALLPMKARSALSLIDQGDTTFDPNTGLVWLDLKFTQGLSYNAVLGGEGSFTTSLGYRFATANEVEQLFLHAGAPSIGFPVNPPVSIAVPAAQNALALLGCTLSLAATDRSWMLYDPASDPALPTEQHVPTAVFGEGEIGGGYPDREGFFLIPGLYEDRDRAYPEIGSALVKLVPEPASPLLFCLGTALTLAGRKRK